MTDPLTALPTSENYGIDAQYNLIEIASNKSVMTGSTFSRVSYDMPGSYQRFARARAFRDAEDRAAQEIAENPDPTGLVLRRRHLMPGAASSTTS